MVFDEGHPKGREFFLANRTSELTLRAVLIRGTGKIAS
jgi:hypothetical protein